MDQFDHFGHCQVITFEGGPAWAIDESLFYRLFGELSVQVINLEPPWPGGLYILVDEGAILFNFSNFGAIASRWATKPYHTEGGEWGTEG